MKFNPYSQHIPRRAPKEPTCDEKLNCVEFGYYFNDMLMVLQSAYKEHFLTRRTYQRLHDIIREESVQYYNSLKKDGNGGGTTTDQEWLFPVICRLVLDYYVRRRVKEKDLKDACPRPGLALGANALRIALSHAELYPRVPSARSYLEQVCENIVKKRILLQTAMNNSNDTQRIAVVNNNSYNMKQQHHYQEHEQQPIIPPAASTRPTMRFGVHAAPVYSLQTTRQESYSPKRPSTSVYPVRSLNAQFARPHSK